MQPIVVDYHQKKIRSPDGGPDEVEISAIEAVDQAELIYAILQPDVVYLLVDGKAFVQAKLTAAEEDGDASGKGVTETSAVLYSVDGKRTDDNKLGKKKLAGEPKERVNIGFYVNQTFLRAQEKADTQLCHVGPSFVSNAGRRPRLFGSILYAECGSDEVRLNMFSADLPGGGLLENLDEGFDYP